MIGNRRLYSNSLPTPAGGRASCREALFEANSGAAATGRKARAARPFASNEVSFQEKHSVSNYSWFETFEFNQIKFAPSQLLPDFLGSDRVANLLSLIWTGQNPIYFLKCRLISSSL
jgi:hypothetical protein